MNCYNLNFYQSNCQDEPILCEPVVHCMMHQMMISACAAAFAGGLDKVYINTCR